MKVSAKNKTTFTVFDGRNELLKFQLLKTPAQSSPSISYRMVKQLKLIKFG